jgi:hypothetical protein
MGCGEDLVGREPPTGSPSWAATHPADKAVSGNSVPCTPGQDVIMINRVGQISDGLVGQLTVPGPAQDVHHFLPAPLLCTHTITPFRRLLRECRLPSVPGGSLAS